MAKIEDFKGYQPCDKIPPKMVAAFTDIKLDPTNPTGIILESSWGTTYLDLKNIVKNGETITHLELAPDENPTVLRYTNEAGDYECITGDELSRIISLQLLKDVDQTSLPEDGDCYVYNGQTGLFELYDLKGTIGDLNTLINRLQNQINLLAGRVAVLEAKLTPPADAPEGVAVCFGNINHISDKDYTGSNTLNKNHGLYTHTLAADVLDDLVAS